MKRLSKKKLLDYTIRLAVMLVSEASGDEIGSKGLIDPAKEASKVPFNERRALLADLNRTLLVMHKVEPEEEHNALDSMKELLNGSGKTESRARGNNGHNLSSTTINANPVSFDPDDPGESEIIPS